MNEIINRLTELRLQLEDADTPPRELWVQLNAEVVKLLNLSLKFEAKTRQRQAR